MYLALPIIEFASCMALLTLIMVRGQRHIGRKDFCIFLTFMALWGFFIFVMRATSSLTTAMLWERFVFWAILSAALFFYRFALALTGSQQRRFVLYPLYLGYFLVLGLLPSELVLQGMQMKWYGKAPIIGPLFILYVVWVYLPIVLSLVALIKNHRNSRITVERTRYQYIILGTITMLVGGTTDYLPSLGINTYPMGIIGNILFCVLATVAMLRGGLLDVNLVLRRGAAYSLVGMTIFGVFGTLIFLFSAVFRGVTSPISFTFTIAAVLFVAAGFQVLLTKTQHLVDRCFFRERYDYILALQRFGSEAKSGLDLEQLSSSLVTAAANGMESRGAYLLMPSPDTGQFKTAFSCGQSGNDDISFPVSGPLVATMRYQDNLLDTNEIVDIPSLSSLTVSDRQVLIKKNIELVVPLKNKGRLVGLLLLSSKISREPFSSEEKVLLKTVANSVAVRLDQAGKYESMRKEQYELKRAMGGAINAISLVVEARDPYTAGHQRRVAELARAIAKEMGLSEWSAEGIHVTGLLHDVGKVVVPAEILSKPGKLSQHEFNLIKNHPQVAYEILKDIDFPWPVTKAILQHHERCNGSGYPQGLAREDITLEAKILGVSDVVEAMSSHRPYRPAVGLSGALREIAQMRGILYDAEVVDACLHLLQSNSSEFENLMAVAATQERATARG